MTGLKIIIVGAGKLGLSLARHLSQENHDITIIDKSEEALHRAAETLDVMCFKGTGASPAALKQAGAASSDLVLATAAMDEVNMLCSLAAKQLGAKCTVAQVRDAEYYVDISSFQKDLNIDAVVNPEYTAALEIFRLLRCPGAASLTSFFGGAAELLSIVVQENDLILGCSLTDLSENAGTHSFLVCAVERNGEFMIPNSSFIPRQGDYLYIVGEPAGIRKFIHILGRSIPKVRSVFLVGGSRIAYYLASILDQNNIKVTLIEIKETRCRFLSEKLPNALILHGDGTDQELLAAEHFTSSDALIALTDRDAENLSISLYARQQGLKNVITKSKREESAKIARSAGLDSVVSSNLITNGILQVVRSLENQKGSVINNLCRIADHKAEAIEFTINKTARHLGIPLQNMSLKKGVRIAAIFHEGKVLIPDGTASLARGDQVIVICRGHGILDFNDIYLS